jgi:hypothetical protein
MRLSLIGIAFPVVRRPRTQFRPSQARIRFPRQALETWDTSVEPPFKSRSLLPFRQQQNAESHLAEDDRIDGDVRLVRAKPFDRLHTAWYMADEGSRRDVRQAALRLRNEPSCFVRLTARTGSLKQQAIRFGYGRETRQG